MSGLRNAFVAAPLAGMTWVCLPKKDRGNTFALMDGIERAQAQRIVAAPVVLRHVNLLGARIADAVFASTKALYCTGTDLNAGEVRRFHARFGIPVVNYYGLSETVGLCLGQDVHYWSADDGSVGRPVGCKVRIVDDEGREVAQGGVGELQVLLEHPMSGYLHDAEATEAMFDGPWLRTGDLVRHDNEGRVFIVGRRGNFIKTLGTEKVQPQEIEAVLEACPGVAEAAVFGWADPAGGERIAALIVATDGASPADSDLARFVLDRLGAARVPAIFRHVAVIPRSANGKILRKQLGEFI
jgi:acyl-coenzyme A synthetase/AMP-(fatty) acid ligase